MNNVSSCICVSGIKHVPECPMYRSREHKLAARVKELENTLDMVLCKVSEDPNVMGPDSRATADWFVDAAAVLLLSEKL